MKVAITGKGGVGKSTLAGMLAHLASLDGKTVLAVDSDPDADLAFALGIPERDRSRIVPITAHSELIEERTGAKLKKFGQIFKLNPDISDIADKYCYDFGGIRLLVMGAIEAGGSGCACPENVFLRNLLSEIILKRDELVIVDLEAGFEHLGRATAQGVDVMIVVAEPTAQSVATAQSIAHLAGEIGLRELRLVGNKIMTAKDQEYLIERLPMLKPLGYLPYSDRIRQADQDGVSMVDHLDTETKSAFQTVYHNLYD
jgi:CO dehydrogenase maturation factor